MSYPSQQDRPSSVAPNMPRPLTSPDDRTYGMVMHLAPLLAYALPAVGGVVGPLVAWLILKDKSAYADDQGKEALNFQLTLFAVAAALVVFGIFTLGIGFVLVGPLLGLIAVVQLAFVVIATIAASEGRVYRYPYSLRLVK